MNIVFLCLCLCLCLYFMSLLSVDTVRPLTVRILTKQLPLVADRRYDVSCESAGSRPSAVITWYKGKRQLRRVKVGNWQHIKCFLTTDVSLYAFIVALVFSNCNESKNFTFLFRWVRLCCVLLACVRFCWVWYVYDEFKWMNLFCFVSLRQHLCFEFCWVFRVVA